MTGTARPASPGGGSPRVRHGAHPGPALLFVPASNDRAMRKAVRLDVGAVIVDLEDAVAPEAKIGAREAMRAALDPRARRAEEGRADRHGASGPAPALAVRINPFGTPWFEEDLLAARALAPRAIVLPKVEAPDDLARVETALAEMDAPDSIRLWAMLETPLGLMRAGEIARSANLSERSIHAGFDHAGFDHADFDHAGDGRLEALVVGINDIVAATGVAVADGRMRLHPWLMGVVLAARAGGLMAYDGVRNEWRDEAAMLMEAREGAAMGFDGKTLIHPDQIRPTVQGFAPSPEVLANARAIVDAFAAAPAGTGLVAPSGRMVERMHLTAARRLLARAGEAVPEGIGAGGAETGEPSRDGGRTGGRDGEIGDEERDRAMTGYRLITGPDDASFCHRVSEALSNGWRLHGPPVYAADGHGGMRCAQAVTKEADRPYEPGMTLSSI